MRSNLFKQLKICKTKKKKTFTQVVFPIGVLLSYSVDNFSHFAKSWLYQMLTLFRRWGWGGGGRGSARSDFER